ncbi:glutathione S-transferase family protein [Sphingomonas sp. NSE70-1]|uniref:Glutathione S-transferase family protein n=1 Tax=Sphingomonas caseinilyticus TaxID=2908205 RepID=A0ABT0RX21_9SPHN|nr:glutathione S-transferase family protein [Sphingomonas caseinilyticus]MCL6699573.1 glutathione S-transferase family protein [Sphingomonas caseinilyticus]
MSEIIFYHNPMSRGQIIRWMLEEVGAPYDTEILDYASSMKDESYRAINPMMKVPAISHNGKIVTECAAICAYLADVFPEAGLGPRENEKADYYRWLFFAAGPLEQAVTNKAVGFEPSAERERMFGYGNYDLAVNTLADHLAGRDYVCGSRFTAADVYVGSAVLWGVQFGTMPKLDSFVAYADRIGQREAYKRGKDEDNQLIAEMQAAG